MAEGPGDRQYPSGGSAAGPGLRRSPGGTEGRGQRSAVLCPLQPSPLSGERPGGSQLRCAEVTRGSGGAVRCGVPCERGRGASAVREPLLPLTLCRRSAPAVRVVPQDGALSLWCTVTERSAGCGSNAGNGGEALGEPLWWGTERRGGSRGGCDLRPCRARGCRRPAPPGRVPVPP